MANLEIDDDWYHGINTVGQVLTITSTSRTPPVNSYAKRRSSHFPPVKAMLTHKITTERHCSSDILCCAFSGRLLAVGYTARIVRLFSIERQPDGKQRVFETAQSPLCAHSYAVNALAFSESGSHLVTASQDGTAALWDTRTGSVLCSYRHDDSMALRCCALSSDGSLLATGSDDETACIWRADNMTFVRKLGGHSSTVHAVSFTPNNEFAITGDNNGNLRLWRVHGEHRKQSIDSSPICLIEAHDLGVTCAQFAPVFTESTLLCGDIQKARESPNTATASRRVSMPSNRQTPVYTLASGGMDDSVKIWKVCDSQPHIQLVNALHGQEGNIMCLAYSSDGLLLATGAGDRSVVIWETEHYTKLTTISHHQRYLTCVAFSRDSKLLATGSNDKTLAIWRLIRPDEPEDELELQSSSVNGEPHVPLRKDKVENGAKVEEARLHNQWSVDDVVVWLKENQLQSLELIFRQNKIDGQQLVRLDEPTLRTSLNIESLAQRQLVLAAIDRLKDDGALLAKHMQGVMKVKEDRINHHERHWPPNEILCPITKEIMRDPVVATDGYSYERTALQSWFDGGSMNSPMTNAPLMSTQMISNRALRLLIHTLVQNRELTRKKSSQT